MINSWKCCEQFKLIHIVLAFPHKRRLCPVGERRAATTRDMLGRLSCLEGICEVCVPDLHFETLTTYGVVGFAKKHRDLFAWLIPVSSFRVIGTHCVLCLHLNMNTSQTYTHKLTHTWDNDFICLTAPRGEPLKLSQPLLFKEKPLSFLRQIYS